MSWWLWLLLGLALLASEAFTPGAFFVFFFGLSAIAVGLAVRLGGHAPGWFQWFLFSLLSVLSVAFLGLALLVMIVISRTAVVVPQQSAFVVERLGRYRATLDAGFHILLPFIDAIRYRHSLKEHAGEIPEQICITRDNVQVHVDGAVYLKVLNPERASSGASDS